MFQVKVALLNYDGIGIVMALATSLLSTQHYSKDWLAQNQDNMSEWSDMSTRGLLLQCASAIQIQLNPFFYYKADIIII